MFVYKEHIRQNINTLIRLGVQRIASKLDLSIDSWRTRTGVLVISCPGGH